MDKSYLLPVINLGNLYYKTGRYSKALVQYADALTVLEKDKHQSIEYVKLLLKVSIVYYELEDFRKAEEYYLNASAIAPAEVDQYAYLGETGNKKAKSAGYTLSIFSFAEE